MSNCSNNGQRKAFCDSKCMKYLFLGIQGFVKFRVLNISKIFAFCFTCLFQADTKIQREKTKTRIIYGSVGTIAGQVVR